MRCSTPPGASLEPTAIMATAGVGGSRMLCDDMRDSKGLNPQRPRAESVRPSPARGTSCVFGCMMPPISLDEAQVGTVFVRTTRGNPSQLNGATPAVLAERSTERKRRPVPTRNSIATVRDASNGVSSGSTTLTCGSPNGVGSPSLCTTAALCGCTTTGNRRGRSGSALPRGTVKPRDVRSGDANRRRVGLRRSSRRLAVGQREGREHPYPARGECAIRDNN